MKIKNQTILNILYFLAMLVFLSLTMIAVGIVISYSVSLVDNQVSKDLFQGVNLYNLQQYSLTHYSIIVFYKVLYISMLAYIAFAMTELLRDFNMSNPFNEKVVKLLEKLCIAILSVWVITLIHNIHLKVMEVLGGLSPDYIEGGFLIWSAMVYVLAQVFKRGIEIQTENELTV